LSDSKKNIASNSSKKPNVGLLVVGAVFGFILVLVVIFVVMAFAIQASTPSQSSTQNSAVPPSTNLIQNTVLPPASIGPYTFDGNFRFTCPKDWNFYSEYSDGLDYYNCNIKGGNINFALTPLLDESEARETLQGMDFSSTAGTGATVTQTTSIEEKTISGNKFVYVGYVTKLPTGIDVNSQLGFIICPNKVIMATSTYGFDEYRTVTSAILESFNCKN